VKAPSLEDHLRGSIATAIKDENADAAIKEMVTAPGKAARQ